LLDEPVREFERVTTRFGLLPECARELAQEEYRLQFLEYGLRHTQFAVQDVAIAPCILKHTAELYRWGYKLATDQTSTDDEDFCQFLVKVESTYREFVPAMRYVNVLETELSQANAAQEAYRGQIEQAQETCKGLDAVVAAR